MSDYYYCPECDTAALDAVRKGEVIERDDTLYCVGKLGSRQHEPTEVELVSGPPVYTNIMDKRIFSYIFSISIASGFLAWFYLFLRGIPVAITAGLLIFFSVLMMLMVIVSGFFNDEQIQEEIRKKASIDNKKEMIRKVYGLEWKYGRYNGWYFFLSMGMITLTFLILPYAMLFENDLTNELKIFFGFTGIGFGFLSFFMILFLSYSSDQKLVPTNKKETHKIIKRALVNNGIQYKTESQDYFHMKKLFKDSSAGEKYMNPKYVCDDLNIEMSTGEDYRGRYIDLKYNKIKNWRYKRKHNEDLIGSIKDTIDTFVEFY